MFGSISFKSLDWQAINLMDSIITLSAFPTADIIIHSGDISFAGDGEEVMDFIEWFGGLDYKCKIFIAGNHDFCLDGKDPARIQLFLPENMYYLCESGVEIEGICFWGIPYMMSYELQLEKYQRSLATIPANTEILITHRPPLGILYKSAKINFGCLGLLEAVRRICPLYHCFGHIHDAYSIEKLEHTTFVNAALVDEKYQLLNKPVVFDI
ncbi:MAG: metallophosphatase domain-containing protein [Bacteroidales bacterium]|jgi:Icc-related predicted phosphoesterase|nr:metallophosphatase domain-containing protein [Bacteroidales bacterium]